MHSFLGSICKKYILKKTKNEPKIHNLIPASGTKQRIIMAGHDQRVNLIINQGRQLGRSLLLLAHYTTVFVAFVGRTVQWMVDAVKWTSLFARYTVSVFDSIYRHLHWGKRKSVAREICPSSDTEPQ